MGAETALGSGFDEDAGLLFCEQKDNRHPTIMQNMPIVFIIPPIKLLAYDSTVIWYNYDYHNARIIEMTIVIFIIL